MPRINRKLPKVNLPRCAWVDDSDLIRCFRKAHTACGSTMCPTHHVIMNELGDELHTFSPAAVINDGEAIRQFDRACYMTRDLTRIMSNPKRTAAMENPTMAAALKYLHEFVDRYSAGLKEMYIDGIIPHFDEQDVAEPMDEDAVAKHHDQLRSEAPYLST